MIIKGFLVGIGKIIPGVSGALIAFSLGIYEKCIYILSNLKKELLPNIKFIFSLCIGIILAILIGSRVINFLFIKYNIPTIYFFLGLIIGTVPSIMKKTTFNFRYLLIGIISFIIPTIICFFKSDLNLDSYFLLGIIEAISTIIPGISGTAIMLLLGNYDLMLSLMMNPFKPQIIVFLFSFFIMVIIISKIMNFLLNKHLSLTYYIIIGFLFSSIISLYISIMYVKINLLTGIISLLLLIIGVYISKILNNCK